MAEDKRAELLVQVSVDTDTYTYSQTLPTTPSHPHTPIDIPSHRYPHIHTHTLTYSHTNSLTHPNPTTQTQAGEAYAGHPSLYSRTFTPTSCSRPGEVRILQFNVLADALSGLQEAKGGFFAAPEGCLEWELRKWRLLEEILRADADVVAMQEVDHYADWFAPRLEEAGYVGAFVKKPNSPCLKFSDLEDGCALFVRPEVARIESVSHLNYSDANQVALIAHLVVTGKAGDDKGSESGGPEKPIIVAVTHLKASKSESGEEVREAQVRQLVEAVASARENVGDAVPVFICADLNAAPKDGKYAARAYPAVFASPGLSLASAYASPEEPEYTTWKLRPGSEAKHTIDYIFYTPGAAEPTALWSIPPPDVIVDTRLPSFEYPSDHFSLAADFALQ